MIVLLSLCALLGALYLYTSRTFKYWENKGVTYEKPIPLFGNVAPLCFGRKTSAQLMEDLYWKYPNEKAVGFFLSSYPELLVRDPEMVKRIWTTDFQHFTGRGIYRTDNDNSTLELLMRNLLLVEGDLWRLLRQSTTPAFSTGKLKAMFPLIVERAERLRIRTRNVGAGARPVDARDLMARYTMDLIGACGLGVNTDALQDKNSNFQRLKLNLFQIQFKEVAIVALKSFFPYTFKHLKIHSKLEKDLCELVTGVLRQRNYKPSDRHDFIDLMLKIKEKGKIECESMEKMKPDGTPERVSMAIDDEFIAAQAYLFFTAGYETSSLATSATLHEIAYNPKVQKKIQAEIDQVLAKHKDKLCYEAINEMHYLEWALKEGMRVRPPVGNISRICRRKYTIQELGVTLDENTRILVSAQALHNDPKYWESPEEFRPERFSSDNNEPKHKFAYLPFGCGPRACIGERMALMQSLAGMAAILSQFSVAPAPNSVRQPVLDPTSYVVQGVCGGYPLIFTPRSEKLSI